MKERIKQFIEETFLVEFSEHINDDSDLFKAGIIDSHGYIQLIKFIGKEFNIKFSDEEILSNVLVSLSSLSEFAEKKQKK